MWTVITRTSGAPSGLRRKASRRVEMARLSKVRYSGVKAGVTALSTTPHDYEPFDSARSAAEVLIDVDSTAPAGPP